MRVIDAILNRGSFDEVFDVPYGQLLIPRASDHGLWPQKASSWDILEMQCQISQDGGMVGIGLCVPQLG